MRIIVWDSSFRRAFKRIVHKPPQIEQKIFKVLELLIADPFYPALGINHRLFCEIKSDRLVER